MRASALFNKIAGFIKISGYEQMAKIGPGILMSSEQMVHIVNRVSSTFPELGDIRKKVLIENSPASFGLVKEAVYVKMQQNTTRWDRLQVSNSMFSVVEDQYLVLMDILNLHEDMAKNMQIIDFFSGCTSTICFILGAF